MAMMDHVRLQDRSEETRKLSAHFLCGKIQLYSLVHSRTSFETVSSAQA